MDKAKGYYLEGEMKGVYGKEEFNYFFNIRKNKGHLKPLHFKSDIYVNNTIEDYMCGIDKELEAAADYLGKKEENSNLIRKGGI